MYVLLGIAQTQNSFWAGRVSIIFLVAVAGLITFLWNGVAWFFLSVYMELTQYQARHSNRPSTHIERTWCEGQRGFKFYAILGIGQTLSSFSAGPVSVYVLVVFAGLGVFLQRAVLWPGSVSGGSKIGFRLTPVESFGGALLFFFFYRLSCFFSICLSVFVFLCPSKSFMCNTYAMLFFGVKVALITCIIILHIKTTRPPLLRVVISSSTNFDLFLSASFFFSSSCIFLTFVRASFLLSVRCVPIKVGEIGSTVDRI